MRRDRQRPRQCRSHSGSPQEGGRYARVDWDEQTGGEGQVAAAQGEDGGCDVVGQHFALEQCSLGVVCAEFVFRYPVDGGPGGTPAACEDPGASDDAIGVDPVDPDADLAEFGGEEPYLVGLVGFGGAVGDVGGTGDDGVLAADVDDVSAHA